MGHKENRKIIKVGQSAFGIILPISWIRYYELHKGDEVETISNGTIIIKPKPMPILKEYDWRK